MLIFTDAAYEGGVGSYGIVAVDTGAGEKYVAGGDLPDWLIEFWHRDSPDQVIGQCEAFAVVLARLAFASMVTGRRTIFFVDNESSREVLVKGSSRSRTLLMLGALFFQLETADGAITWLERVPSASNIADAPSRGEVENTASLTQGKAVCVSDFVSRLGSQCMGVDQMPWSLLA